MMALSHWARPYQNSRAAASIRPTLSFMSTWGQLEDDEKESSVTNDVLGMPKVKELDRHQQEFISSIARYICRCSDDLS